MMFKQKGGASSIGLGIFLGILGIGMIVVGWVIPSRFNSIPVDVLREAATPEQDLLEYAFRAVADQNIGAAELFLSAFESFGELENQSVAQIVEERREADPLIARWGTWDPFLSAALQGIPLSEYSDQPGALGVVLSTENLQALRGFLENSKSPLVSEILSTGELETYKRLFPVQSSSGRPLEATLIVAALLAQGERLHPDLRQQLRLAVWEAKGSGDASHVEDFYLDLLSLSRLFDFGQLKALLGSTRSLGTVGRLRYAFHRRPDEAPTLFAASVISERPGEVMDYLGKLGDDGIEALSIGLRFGKGGLELLLREQLPIEERKRGYELAARGSDWEASLASFSLGQPVLALSLKYALFFVGAFFVSWGSSFFSAFYQERVSTALAISQRIFISLASVIIFVILSEPDLASGSAYQGFSFRFVIPVLAQEGGEIVIKETEPTTAMDPSTLLSIAFFFLLQILVFLICLLKVREIDRKEVDTLVKLRLMENEENLFDTGLYVGIAGTCISLVLQVLGLIEGNLLAAYSSNLFGILCVAIVKIRLVRPYKNKLILSSEEIIASLEAQSSSKA